MSELAINILLSALVALFLLLIAFWFGYWSGREKDQTTVYPRKRQRISYRKPGEDEFTQIEVEIHEKRLQRFDRNWRDNLWQGISTEMIGAAITTLIFATTISVYEFRSEQSQYREELLRNLGSSNNAIALRAVQDLRSEGWLFDGTTAGLDLFGADLRNANLSGADLSGVDLRFADLRGASLLETDFSGADLRYVLFQSANTRDLFDIDEIRAENLEIAFRDGLDVTNLSPFLENFCESGVLQSWWFSSRTNFSGADLRFADLSESDQSFADFRGANLLDANFTDANLYMANLTQSFVTDQFIPVALTLDETLFNQVGNPPVLSRDTMLPDGRNWRESRPLLNYVDPEGENYIDLSVYWKFVETPPEERTELGVSSLSCRLPFQIIPYPERQPGPFRQSNIE